MIEKRPTKIKVKLDNLVNNLKIINRIVKNKSKIFAVVKANAYGHGSVEIVRTLREKGVNNFVVACSGEAEEIFKNESNIRILSLGKIYKEDIELSAKYPYSLTVSSYRDLELLETINCKLNVHIKIDTGMGWCGLWSEQLKKFMKKIEKNKKINIEGVLTHFPNAEDDRAFTNMQIMYLEKIMKFFTERGYNKIFFHCANSEGLLNYDNSFFNVVRPGIILYGSYKDIDKKKELGLKPVMEFVSKIVDIKIFKKGDTIGYARAFKVLKNNFKCALIPVGYADGYSRFFYDKGVVLINNKICKVVGRISMDWIMVDVNSISVDIGDDVILFGDDNWIIDVDRLAASIGTISYEIFCNVGKNLRKCIVYDKTLSRVYR